MGQVRLNVVKKVKKKALSISFFSYFTWGIPFKAKIVVVQIREWKFKASIARNATYEGRLGPNFCPICVKIGKKADYFQEYHFS